MLGYCPGYYETSRIFKSYLQAVGLELDSMKQGISETLNQFFVSTSTWSLDIWENELGLSSFAGKPEDQRRSRIISKILGYGTVNIYLVKSVAESYVYGTVAVTEYPEQYSFSIKFVDIHGIPPNLDDLQSAIEEIKPAHLAVIYGFSYMTWNELDNKNITWDQLDAKSLTWDDFETGGWLDA